MVTLLLLSGIPLGSLNPAQNSVRLASHTESLPPEVSLKWGCVANAEGIDLTLTLENESENAVLLHWGESSLVAEPEGLFAAGINSGFAPAQGTPPGVVPPGSYLTGRIRPEILPPGVPTVSEQDLLLGSNLRFSLNLETPNGTYWTTSNLSAQVDQESLSWYREVEELQNQIQRKKKLRYVWAGIGAAGAGAGVRMAVAYGNQTVSSEEEASQANRLSWGYGVAGGTALIVGSAMVWRNQRQIQDLEGELTSLYKKTPSPSCVSQLR